MANSQTKNMLFGFAVAAALMFVYQGVKAYQVLSTKADAQLVATEGLHRWKATYKALRESRARWDRSYYKEDQVQDIVTLLALIDFRKYGVETDDDNAVVSKVESVRLSDADLGLRKVCLTTGVGDAGSLFVRATDYHTLLTGLSALAKRRDIEIGSITLQGNGPFPMARLGDFCVFLRIS